MFPQTLTRALCLAAILAAVAIEDFAEAHAVRVLRLKAGDIIATEGDSLTYGWDTTASGTQSGSVGSKSPTPYPETLQHLLCDRVSVINRGYPGDRTLEGLVRWQNVNNVQLAVLMYGTNDTGDFRPAHEGALTPDSYRAVLMDLVRRRQAQGARVLILSPPPAQDKQVDASIEPFRVAAQQAASITGADFLSTAEAFGPGAATWNDGLHLTPEGYRLLAQRVASVVTVDGCPRPSSP